MTDTTLIIVAAAGILLLLFLIIRTKLQAFIALLLTSSLVGIASGMPLENVIASIKNGMGGTLGFVAIVVGLGAMFGSILEASGGIERLANTLLDKFGEDNAQWAMGITGFIVAIPVFFDVGFIILVPLVYGLSKKSGRSLLYYGIPLASGLAITHSFIPPTPGPIAVAELLKADLGWVILFGIIAGIPALVISGPVFGRYIAGKIHIKVPDTFQTVSRSDSKKMPGFATVIILISIPLFLILLNTLSGVLLKSENLKALKSLLGFIGHPFIALLIATLLAIIMGVRKGFSKEELQKIATKALEPAGIIILITGAGGVFKQILIDSGVGDVLANMMAESTMPPVLLAFAVAAIVRVAQGSATVAMITAAGIISPVISALQLEGAALGLIVIAISAGASILSHVNDSGFWLVSRYLGLTEQQTLKSWTVMVTILALTGLAVVFIISLFMS